MKNVRNRSKFYEKWPFFADGDRDDGAENTIFDQNTKNVVLTLKVAYMPILEVVFRPFSVSAIKQPAELKRDNGNMCPK